MNLLMMASLFVAFAITLSSGFRTGYIYIEAAALLLVTINAIGCVIYCADHQTRQYLREVSPWIVSPMILLFVANSFLGVVFMLLSGYRVDYVHIEALTSLLVLVNIIASFAYQR